MQSNVSTLFATAALAMLLAASAALPSAFADSLPEDLVDAARDDGEQDPCPTGSLDQLVLCIVDQTVNDNPIVRAVVEHAGYHYQNASNARNYTAAELLVIAAGTSAYEWQVEYAGYVYAGSTLANGIQAEHDAEAIVGDAAAYGNDAFQGECVFLFGQPCFVTTFDAERIGGGMDDGDVGNPTCAGLINIIRCHYVRVANDGLDQADNTTGDASGAADRAVDRQDAATATYVNTVLSATRAYSRFVIVEADETAAYMQGFANRECKLVYSGCPPTGVTLDSGWIDLLA